MAEQKAGYWVVIPSDVFYDHKLPPRSIMLYGVISNFCNHYGRCTVKNEVFARFFDVKPRSIQRLLEQLQSRGHIRIDVYNRGGETVRVITLAVAYDRHDKNVTPRHDKNVTQNNKKDINIPPIAPQGAEGEPKTRPGRKRPCQTAELPPELEESFSQFWAAYPPERRKDKQKARQRWGQLSPDSELVAVILASIQTLTQTDDWQRGAIPLPSTFLNNRRWEDAEEVSTTGQGGVEQW